MNYSDGFIYSIDVTNFYYWFINLFEKELTSCYIDLNRYPNIDLTVCYKELFNSFFISYIWYITHVVTNKTDDNMNEYEDRSTYYLTALLGKYPYMHNPIGNLIQHPTLSRASWKYILACALQEIFDNVYKENMANFKNFLTMVVDKINLHKWSNTLISLVDVDYFTPHRIICLFKVGQGVLS